MSHKLIIKNSLYLYIQTITIILLGFLSIRYVLDNIGTVDYGIMTVIGGILGMMTILSNAINASVQRFLSFELGKNNIEKVKAYFNSSLFIYSTLGVLIVILGLIFKNSIIEHMLTLPEDRLNIAHYIYSLVLLNLVFTISTSPFQAILNARENMKIIAIVTIIQYFFILLLSISLYFIDYDKLLFYVIGSVIINILFPLIIIVITYRLYEECHFEKKYFFNLKLSKEQLGFSGWNLFGGVSSIVPDQGITVLINIFFGPIINGSYSISYQVTGKLKIFSDIVMRATRPQIIKAESVGDRNKVHKLSFTSSKFSFFILYLLALPLYFELPFVLDVWLVTVPEFVIKFCRLIIIIVLINQITINLISVMLAIGKIALYQSVVGSILISLIPIGYILFIYDYSVEYILYCQIIITALAGTARVIFVRVYALMNIFEWFNIVVLRIIAIVIPSLLTVLFIQNFLVSGWERFFLVIAVSMMVNIILIFFVGTDQNEKTHIINYLRFIKEKYEV